MEHPYSIALSLQDGRTLPILINSEKETTFSGLIHSIQTTSTWSGESKKDQMFNCENNKYLVQGSGIKKGVWSGGMILADSFYLYEAEELDKLPVGFSLYMVLHGGADTICVYVTRLPDNTPLPDRRNFFVKLFSKFFPAKT